MDRPFVPWGTAHVTAIGLTVLVPMIFATAVRLSGSRKFARAISLLFAGELLATWALWYWLIAVRGWLSPATILPLQLCDWATIAALITLFRPNQRSYELSYFWAFSGTLQALLTPDLSYGFPDLRFVVFFAFHGGAIASVLYLTLGMRLRPYAASIPRAIAWSLLYLVCALAANRLFHTNFGYLSAKPLKPSLLDVMGPWPIYIAELMGLGLALVVLLYAPFYVADALRQAKRASGR